jgi:hypothetical protein
MIGTTAMIPSASALHHLSRQRDERVRDHRATDHERDQVVQSAKREALAGDALDEQRSQQPFSAARNGECDAHLERAAGMQVGRQASDPRGARERGPHVARGHEHHAQVDAARRPQHGHAGISDERVRQRGRKEVEAREGRGGGNQPQPGGGGPHSAHHAFSVGTRAPVL